MDNIAKSCWKSFCYYTPYSTTVVRGFPLDLRPIQSQALGYLTVLCMATNSWSGPQMRVVGYSYSACVIITLLYLAGGHHCRSQSLYLGWFLIFFSGSV